MIYKRNRSFDYAPLVPVPPPDISPVAEKEWGEPPSPDEIFSTTDLGEFAGTDFSYLHFAPLNPHPGVRAASQYDPYAEVHLSGVQSMPHAQPALSGSVPSRVTGTVSPGSSVIPGFAPEIPSTGPDAGLYGELEFHPKPAADLRFERDHPTSSSSDADIYGSPPHNLSPPRSSDRFKSSQADAHHDHQLVRRFDTSALLYVIPEVCPYLSIVVRWVEVDDSVASLPSCSFCRPFHRSSVAHPTFQ